VPGHAESTIAANAKPVSSKIILPFMSLLLILRELCV